MQRSFKSQVLKIASIVPSIICVISFIVLYGRKLFGVSDVPISDAFQGILSIWLIALLFSIVIVLGLMIAFVFHVVVFNKKMSSRQKLIWLCILWFLNVFAIPVYYHKFLDNGRNL